MRLGTRLTIAFLVVALVPAGAILALTWTRVESGFEEEYFERIRGAAESLADELDRIGTRLTGKVRGLADNKAVDDILIDMERGDLDRQALKDTAGKWMSVWEFDLLWMLDGQGKVLSCGHLPARFGKQNREMLHLAAREIQEPVIQRVQVRRDGQIREYLAVLVGAVKRFKGTQAEVALVGGRLLDEDFLERLEVFSRASVAVVDQDDQIIMAGPRLRERAQGGRLPDRDDPRWRRMPLVTGGGGQQEVRLAAWVSHERQEQARWQILFGAAAAAAGGVIISWLLGLALARRITRPVTALVEGARHVATGDLEHRIPGHYSSEVGELVQTFNRMVSDLAGYQLKLVRAERVAAWQEIARRIAHEIKNPLSPIQVSIETMRKAYSSQHAAFPEIFEESTRAILEEVGALKRIVTEFSDFARLPKPSPVRQSLNPIAENAVNLYRGQAGEVEINFEPADDLPDVMIDRELFGQVLSNLLANALRASRAGGRILVETGVAAERVLVRVSDTGAGMSAEVLEKVFTPYFTTHQDGTGLGLAIVQRIVEDHEGAIEIESTEGSGTAVTVWLPIPSA